MPDFTYETAQMCEDMRYEWSVHECTWHSLYSDEVQTDEEKENYICPRCGGKTVDVMVAV
jgi:predicted SprT family Zn-dependent metalloprotease